MTIQMQLDDIPPELVEFFEPVESPNAKSWMLWKPSPSALAHYATFPRFIPSFAIRAATSEKGCCATCGAPWERCRSKTGEQWTSQWGTNRNTDKYEAEKHLGRQALKEKMMIHYWHQEGWRPTCHCPASEPIPCIVLDPFGGSGTVAVVARQLGRHSIYVDISEKYCRMAMKRIEGQTPMLPINEGHENPTQLALEASG